MSLQIAWIALAYVTGIYVGEWLSVSLGWAFLLAVLVTVWLSIRQTRMAALALCVVLGLLASRARPRGPPLLFDGEPWIVDAHVIDLSERAFGSTRLLVALDRVSRSEVGRSISGVVQVMVAGDLIEPVAPGDRVRFLAKIRPPHGFANPGTMDAEVRLSAIGAIGVAHVHSPLAFVRIADPLERSASLALRGLSAIAAMRAKLSAEIDSVGSGDPRALVRALVLGDRGDLSPSVDEDFRAAGVTHVLSVSGLHLAIASLLFYVGLRRSLLYLPWLGPFVGARMFVGRPAAALAIVATCLYTLLTGAQVATVRACIIAVVVLGGVVLDRRAHMIDALSAAALVILIHQPLSLFDPSFQLSFGAALGCSLIAPRLLSFVPKDRSTSRGFKLVRFVAAIVAASAAALIATAPISAWHFQSLAPMGLLANVVVVPLSELAVVPLGLAGSLLGLAWHPVGVPILMLTEWLARIMLDFSHLAAVLCPLWRVPAPTALFFVGYYGFLIVAIYFAGELLRWRRTFLLVTLGMLMVSLVWGPVERRVLGRVRITFLDVGQGDAAVIELPSGGAIVIDGGGSIDPKFDPGEQILAPFLWRRGIRHIELIVLSHPHPDHANGLGYLAEHFPVDMIWTNGQETEQPGTVRLLKAAHDRGIPLREPTRLQLDGVTLTPLAPLAGTHVETDAALSENDNSLVVSVAYGNRRILFAGDVEAEGEAQVAARPCSADILKVPHHGSKTSSSDGFVSAVHPRYAIISAGADNRWGFPHAQALEAYAREGAEVLRTDELGAITATVDRSGRLSMSWVRSTEPSAPPMVMR